MGAFSSSRSWSQVCDIFVSEGSRAAVRVVQAILWDIPAFLGCFPWASRKGMTPLTSTLPCHPHPSRSPDLNVYLCARSERGDLRWPGDSQCESGRLARIDLHESNRRKIPTLEANLASRW